MVGPQLDRSQSSPASWDGREHSSHARALVRVRRLDDHGQPGRVQTSFSAGQSGSTRDDLESLLRDLRLSFRGLRRTPGTAFIAAFAFALGIGLTTLVFSIIWGVLIRGLPFDEGEELVRLRRTNPSRGISGMNVSIHDLADWRAE